MGIETISGSLNEYRDADSKSVAIAERLRTLEEKMVEMCIRDRTDT